MKRTPCAGNRAGGGVVGRGCCTPVTSCLFLGRLKKFFRQNLKITILENRPISGQDDPVISAGPEKCQIPKSSKSQKSQNLENPENSKKSNFKNSQIFPNPENSKTSQQQQKSILHNRHYSKQILQIANQILHNLVLLRPGSRLAMMPVFHRHFPFVWFNLHSSFRCHTLQYLLHNLILSITWQETPYSRNSYTGTRSWGQSYLLIARVHHTILHVSCFPCISGTMDNTNQRISYALPSESCPHRLPCCCVCFFLGHSLLPCKQVIFVYPAVILAEKCLCFRVTGY